MMVGSIKSVGDERDQGLSVERRNVDVRLAVMETNLENHLVSCVKGQGETNARLSRIEKGITAMLLGLITGGAAMLGFLAKIALHLGPG